MHCPVMEKPLCVDRPEDSSMNKEDLKELLPKQTSIVIWLILLAIYYFVR